MTESCECGCIEVVATGLVYRNPKPFLRAVNAWHPSIARLGPSELLVAFDLGQAVESLDYRTYLSRSTDEGKSWSSPVRLFEDTVDRPTTHSVRINVMGDGSLTAFGGRSYRDDPEEGGLNRKIFGHVPMDLILLRSTDNGVTWGAPQTIEPPLVGPAFEICHRVIELQDGRWLAPTQTLPDWDGNAPNGIKFVILVSRNRGKSWLKYNNVMDDHDKGIYHWECSVEQLPDGRLLAVAWAYDSKAQCSRPSTYAISKDGRTFSQQMPTGFNGETAKVISLGQNRILCLYRNQDKPGLWAHLARIEGDRWVTLGEIPAWEGAFSKMGAGGLDSNMDELANLKFGFPSMTLMPNGDVFAVFWCYEDQIYNIRWLRIRPRQG